MNGVDVKSVEYISLRVSIALSVLFNVSVRDRAGSEASEMEIWVALTAAG